MSVSADSAKQNCETALNAAAAGLLYLLYTGITVKAMDGSWPTRNVANPW